MAEGADESWLRGGGTAGQGVHPCVLTAGQGAGAAYTAWPSGAGRTLGAGAD